MKVAVHILTYNVDTFIEAVLRNIEHQVDKVYLAYPTRPWGYTENSRNTYSNPTKLEYLKALVETVQCPVEIIEGDWLTEDDMRNACLEKSRLEGFDWFIIQDADEFYPESTWEQIKRILAKETVHDHLITTWYNFWKSSQYVMTYKDGGIKGTNAGFAIRCKSQVKFIRKRICNNNTRKVIDCPCYHYGYVMSDEQMREKISTWGHSHELFGNNWYQYKWLNWNHNTKYLHPINPDEWIRAIHFPLAQPDFAEQFSLPIKKPSTISIKDFLGEKSYDLNANLHFIEKSLKYGGKVILGKNLNWY